MNPANIVENQYKNPFQLLIENKKFQKKKEYKGNSHDNLDNQTFTENNYKDYIDSKYQISEHSQKFEKSRHQQRKQKHTKDLLIIDSKQKDDGYCSDNEAEFDKIIAQQNKKKNLLNFVLEKDSQQIPENTNSSSSTKLPFVVDQFPSIQPLTVKQPIIKSKYFITGFHRNFKVSTQDLQVKLAKLNEDEPISLLSDSSAPSEYFPESRYFCASILDKTKKKAIPLCYICLSPDHLAADCPSLICFRCGQTGHFAKFCTCDSKQTCFRCRKKGHKAIDCRVLLMEQKEEDQNLLKCMICHQIGHTNCDGFYQDQVFEGQKAKNVTKFFQKRKKHEHIEFVDSFDELDKINQEIQPCNENKSTKGKYYTQKFKEKEQLNKKKKIIKFEKIKNKSKSKENYGQKLKKQNKSQSLFIKETKHKSPHHHHNNHNNNKETNFNSQGNHQNHKYLNPKKQQIIESSNKHIYPPKMNFSLKNNICKKVKY